MIDVKRFAIPAVVLGFLLMVFMWVMHHGFIEIVVQNPTSSSEINYRIYDQSGSKIYSNSTDSDSVKRFVKNGTYTSLVSQGDKSDFRPIDAQGFFKTTESDSLLQPEKYRGFVGDNPGFCMHYETDILYSYNCGLGGLTSHLPATATLPTTTQTEDDSNIIPSKGLINIDNKDMVLIAGGEDNSVQLYNIDSQLKLTSPINLDEISAEDVSGIMPFQKGFIIYNGDLSVIKYYETPSSHPDSRTITSPTEATNPVEMSVNGSEIGALFNSSSADSDAGDTSSTSPSSIGGGESEFVLTSGESYKFNKIYTSGGFCGSNKLCLISGGVLDIYDTSGGEADYVFSVKDAQKAFSKDGKVVIATSSNVLALDESDLAGSIQISYGHSGYCGIGPAKTGFVLCLINKKGKKSALYVDMKRTNTDSIDKKIGELLDSPDVDDVSIYKNFVYISPNLGTAVRDKNTGHYDYPANLKKSVSRKIESYVKEIGIDPASYKITNPYQ